MASIFSAGLRERQPFAAKLIEAQVVNNRLPGAYLLIGRAQEDKIQLAKELVSALNCSEKSISDERFCLLSGNEATNWCPNCRWIAQDEHPQAWQVLAGDETKTGKIPVEKARELSEELGKSSRYFRAVIVKEASEEYFHRPAANALLKTIEEPKGRIIFLLFALALSDVLKTIASRCQIIELRFSEMSSSTKVAQLEADRRERFEKIFKEMVREMKQQKRGAALGAAVGLAQAIHDAVGQEAELQEVLDFLVAEEFTSLKTELADNPSAVKYAQQLLQLSETSKLQSDHFVSEKAIIDAFAFRWAMLKDECGIAFRA
jgi:hypothetical protein